MGPRTSSSASAGTARPRCSTTRRPSRAISYAARRTAGICARHSGASLRAASDGQMLLRGPRAATSAEIVGQMSKGAGGADARADRLPVGEDIARAAPLVLCGGEGGCQQLGGGACGGAP